jgi:hypothetical protein
MQEPFNSTPTDFTPLATIANVSRLVTKITDRISGDRSEFPLLVNVVALEALQLCGIPAKIFYGQAAWIEVMEDMSLLWAGCWGDNSHFWIATNYGEVVDLNTSVSHRKKDHHNPRHQPKYSPPLLWSRDVPAFYHYVPEGVAEIELTEERDQRWLQLCLQELRQKLPAAMIECTDKGEDELDFPDEPILCPNRRILDDAAQSFRHYDRAIMVQGIPEKPF